MLLSFGFIRFSTRMIRAEVSWWPGNVTPGRPAHPPPRLRDRRDDGRRLRSASRSSPRAPGSRSSPALFGIGVGLTLDEFALWLYLEDVYWSEEGRRSVDAVIVAAIIGGALVLGFVPVSSEDSGSISAIVASIATTLAICLLAAFKGKLWSAMAGMFIAPVGIVAAIRVARPGSSWARRFYKPGSAKLEKSEHREERHNRRWKRMQDLIGGAPSRPSPREDR